MNPSRERRRSPRVAPGLESWLAAPASWPVQLLDLGLGGVAFTSPYRLERGRRLTLQTTLGREAFSGQVQVCWSRPRGPGSPVAGRYEVGASFLPLEESSSRALQAFLKVSRVREQA